MNDFVEPTMPDLPSGTDDLLAGLDKITKERKTAKEKPKAEEKTVEQQADGEKSEAPKYSQDVLLRVFDSLVFEGKYSEEYKARGISVTFRSRTGDDSVLISRALDAYDGKTYMSVQTYSNMLTLAHSLVSYNGKAFEDKQTADKFKFISGLPDAVLTILMSKLNEFDEKVWLAMEEGRKNF